MKQFRGGLVSNAHRLLYHSDLARSPAGSHVCPLGHDSVCTQRAAFAARLFSSPATSSCPQERSVFGYRKTNANTAPRTPRRTCCPHAHVLITVPCGSGFSSSCGLSPGFRAMVPAASAARLFSSPATSSCPQASGFSRLSAGFKVMVAGSDQVIMVAGGS